MAAATHRVVVTAAPTAEQIDAARALIEAAAIQKAEMSFVPTSQRMAVATAARVELGDALAGRPVSLLAARCVAAMLGVMCVAHHVVAS